MSIADFFGKFLQKSPDVVVPITGNLYNRVYFDPETSDQFDLYLNLSKFIAKEFTKVKITLDSDISNSTKIGYLLNIKPNSTQTPNDLLYIFAHGMLENGQVYYKIQSNQRALESIYFSEDELPGYKLFQKEYLQLRRPRKLLDQYTKLLTTLSTKQAPNVLELNTQLKVNDENIQDQIDTKLSNIRNEIDKHGAFITQKDESIKDHQKVTSPDGTALNDLRSLILETYNINEKILTGEYNEENYRAFFATHIQPISNALEELLNAEILGYDDYKNGYSINVIMDLLQFSTLESFTDLANKGIYNGYLTADEVRKGLGKEPLEGGYGKIIWTNANAKRLTNPDGTEYIAPTPNDTIGAAKDSSGSGN
jgi:hypothetical protein